MYLNCIAYTPVGTFSGTISIAGGDEDSLIEARDAMETTKLSYLVLFSGDDEILLPETVLANSVLKFTIDDEPRK